MFTECFEIFPSNENSRMFKTGANEIYLGKFGENLNIVEFPKYKPLNEQFGNSVGKIKWNLNYQFMKFSKSVPFCGNFGKC